MSKILISAFPKDNCVRKRLCGNEERDKLIPFVPPPNTTVYTWFDTETDSMPPTPQSTTGKQPNNKIAKTQLDYIFLK